MTSKPPQKNPNDLFIITREELDRCCNQMSISGYGVSANYVEAMVLSRPAPSPQKTCMCDKYTNCTDCQSNDATIRNATLDGVSGKIWEKTITPYPAVPDYHVVAWDTIKEIVESLRTQPQEPKP